MPQFDYKAFGSDGKVRRGSVEAESAREANEMIFGLSLTPVEVKAAGASVASLDFNDFKARYQRVKPIDLIMYTKQLVTMVRVGIPITQALGILEEQTEHRRLSRISGLICRDIEAGASLSSAMAKHPSVFSPLYCSVVEAGEKSGTLPAVFDRLLYLIEHEAMIKAEVKSAIRYPLLVVGALAAAFIILLGFVIPRFVSFFGRAGLELPLPTRICISLSQFLTQYGLWIFLAVIIMAVIYRRFVQTPRGRYLRDSLLLQIPLIGPVLIKAAMSRFASIFAILQTSGVLILESLRILSNTVGNAAIAAEFEMVRDLLEEGRGISEPLRSARYFPPMMINMVAIGEETGRLDEMLREISAHYDVEVKHTMKKMSDLIGPVLIISLTAVVGFFALAIYMPMWDLTQMAAQQAR